MTRSLPRIVLEPLRPSHATEMFAGLADPTAYQFLPDDPPANSEALRERYQRQLVGRSADGAELWFNWIIRSCETGAAAGYTQATIRNHSALLGYHVFPSVWRQGFGYAAVRRTVHHLFEMPGVEEIRALVDTRNEGSSALLRKLGFGVSHTRLRADFFKGQPSDEREFVLCRPTLTHGERAPTP